MLWSKKYGILHGSGALQRVFEAHQQDVSLTANSKKPRQSSLLGMRWHSGMDEEGYADKREISESPALHLAI